MLKVPAKYKRAGIKIKCLACKYQVSDTCKQNGKGLNSCPHTDKHRYNAIVCIPKSECSRRTKILETLDFSEALIEAEKFRKELKMANYHKPKVLETRLQLMTLLDYATAYLNSMSGEHTPAILIRERSKEHIDDTARALLRFGTCLKLSGYSYKTLQLEDIGDIEVSIFHEYLINSLGLKTRSYNKHIAAMRTFYGWAIRVKDYQGPNPFNHVELKKVTVKEKEMITKNEFEKLLEVITLENGYDANRKNHYKDWLKIAFKLAIETGLRREELVTLKWSDIICIEDGKSVFRINNLKVNRILDGENEGDYIKNVPITKSLMELLNSLGFKHKLQTNEYIITRPENLDLKYMMDALSRSFTHFIKLATDRKLEFKDLRKTYITHLTIALGGDAKLFTGHTNDAVLKSHYLNGAFIAGNLSEFSVWIKD